MPLCPPSPLLIGHDGVHLVTLLFYFCSFLLYSSSNQSLLSSLYHYLDRFACLLAGGLGMMLQAYDPYELKKTRMVESRPRRQRPPRLGPNRTEALKSDPIPYFNIRPDHEHLNPIFLNGFLTDMGKIKGRNETRLTRKSQRFVGKAIRRARAMGVLPTMHKALVYTFEAGSGGVSSRRNIP